VSFKIGKEQQKLFVDHFLAQVLDISLQLVDKGTDKGSPGETIHAVGVSVIKELVSMGNAPKPEDAN
jgi:hypothetical protein